MRSEGSYNAEQWRRAKEASGTAEQSFGGKLTTDSEMLWVMNEEK